MPFKSIVKKINSLFYMTALVIFSLSGLAVADDYYVRMNAPTEEEGDTLHFVIGLFDVLANTTPKPVVAGEVLTVNWTTTTGGTAKSDDFPTQSGSLVFAAGEQSKTFDVSTTEDAFVETDETLTISLSGETIPLGGSIALLPPNDGIIRNDDQVTLTLIAPVQQFESDSSVDTFTVHIDDPILDTNVVATFDYATSNGSAIVGSDYMDNDGAGIDLTGGATDFTFDVSIIDDDVVESNESFIFEITGSTSNVTVLDSSVTGTILNDDHTVTITAVNVEQPETTLGYDFQIEVDPAVQSGEDVYVSYIATSGTATGGDDFSPMSQTIHFIDSSANPATGMVGIIEDTVYEGDETFTVDTSDGGGSTGSLTHGPPAAATITDPYAVTVVGDATVVEEYTNASIATVTVSLDRDNTGTLPIEVNYITSTGTATAGLDYTSIPTTLLTFDNSNPRDHVINVEILADHDIEGSETFLINLSDPSPSDDVTIVESSGTVTIEDNTSDHIITVLPDFTFEEGQVTPATADFSFQVDNAINAGEEVRIDYATADGTAVAGSDYTATSGQVVLTGPTPAFFTHTIPVAIAADGISEGSQDFSMNFTVVGDNYTLSRPQQICTIQDHDFTVGFTGSVAVTEDGNNGTDTPPDRAVFSVVLDRAPQGDEIVTVDYNTSDGDAIADDDYTSTSGTLTFCANTALAGCTTATTDTVTFDVPIIDDAIGENLESFEVTLSNASLNTLIVPGATTVQGQISDDDYNLANFPDVTINESAGTATLTVTLDRTVAAADEVAFLYSTSDGILAPYIAESGSDYTAQTNQTLTIGAGQSSGSVTIDILDDTLIEYDENFSVILTPAQNSFTHPLNVNADADDNATITINIDEKYQFSINDITVVEGDVSEDFTITITPVIQTAAMNGANGSHNVSLTGGTVDGTATANDDYVPLASATYPMPEGVTDIPFTVDIIDDVVSEGASENFFVDITSFVPLELVEIIKDRGVCTILDTDYFVTPGWNTPGGTVTMQSPVPTDYPITNGTPAAITDSAVTEFTITADHDIESITVSPADAGITISPADLTGVQTNAIVTFDATTTVQGYTLDIVFNHAIEMTADAQGTIERTSHIPNTSVSGSSATVIAEHLSDQVFTLTGNADQCVTDLLIDGTPQGAFKTDNSNWHGDTYTFSSVAEDHSIEATFGQAIITVYLEADENTVVTNTTIQGSGTWSACEATDATFASCTDFATGNVHGDTISIPADVGCDTQFIQVSFSDNVDGYTRPDPIEINMGDTFIDQNVTGVYTAFTRQLLVNVTGSGSVTVEPDPEYIITDGRYVYITDTDVTLTAVPDLGWAFDSWSGDVTGTSSPVTITIDMDKTVDALFVEGCQDLDNDGFTIGDVTGTGCSPSAQLDCNDNDSGVNPDATEICEDGIDQDCSGADLPCSGEFSDDDGDGWTEDQGDCNDGNSDIAPGLYDIPGDGIDQDCYDGDQDEGTEMTCVEITDDPVNASMNPAPPLIMFLLDDSGSMDWEFMTDEGNGLYSGEYYLLSYNDQARAYWDNRLSAAQRLEFESQWSEYNKLYYDASVRYQPWPQWHTVAGDATANEQTADPDGYIHADMDTPRLNTSEVTHAWNDTYRYDLNETFFTVAAGGSGQQITVTRHSGSTGGSTLADAVGLSTNANLELNHSEYWTYYGGIDPAPEHIFDNGDGVNVFSTSSGWGESGGTTAWEWSDSAWYDGDNGDWGKWMLNLDAADEGDYYVYVWNDDYSDRDSNARYTVFYYDNNDDLQSEEFYVDQRGMDYGGDGQKWHRLGNSTFHFKAQSATPSTVTVPVAHYYKWSDANGDGVRDNGEVYLITIPGSGRSVGDYELHYYQFNDANSDDRVDDGELVEVTGTDIPGAIVPVRYDNSSPAVLITDSAELAFQERQNFADWFSFYRRRILTAKAAVGLTVADMSGMELGIHTINRSFSSQLEYVDQTTSPELTTFLSNVYDLAPVGSTPLRRGLYDVATYLDETDTGDYCATLHTTVGTDTSVFADAVDGGECQRAYVIAMTDGYYNGSFNMPDSPDNRDGQSTQASIFQDSAEDTLGDIAIRFYDEDLDTTLNNYVPAKNFDTADHQHMVTFGVSFGVFGFYDPDLFPDCLPECTPGEDGCPTLDELSKRDCILTDGSFVCGPGTGPFENQCPEWYPVAGNSKQTIDDLYHASVNGRGKFLNAANPADLVQSMKTIKDLIVDSTGTASSVALNAKELREGALLYQTVYDTEGWGGDMLAKCLSTEGEVERCAVTQCEQSCNDAYTVWMDANCPGGEDSCREAGETNRFNCLVANNCVCESVCPILFSQCEDNCADDVAACNATCADGAAGDACRDTCSETDVTCVETCNTVQDDCLADPSCEDTNESNSNVKWSASTVLDPDPESRFDDTAWQARNIITSTDLVPSAGVPFLWNSMTNTMRAALDPIPASPDATRQEDILEYLRGEDQYEKLSDTGNVYNFRNRSSKIGDFIHAEPYHFAELGVDWVFAGSNDGMLHVFKGDTGEELFAYIPQIVFRNLHELSDPNFNGLHKYYVDGYVTTEDIGNATILVGGLGKGGKGFYSLDLTAAKAHISDVEANAGSIYNWEFSEIYKPHDASVTAATPDNNLGWSYSRPQIVKSRDTSNGAEYMLVFGNGYESVNSHAVLYFLGINADGDIVWEHTIDTGVGDPDTATCTTDWDGTTPPPNPCQCNGLSTPGLIDPDLDGFKDFAYAGDLLGNMWKFDLRDPDRNNWKVYHEDGSLVPQPLFQAKSEAGWRQPITAKPDVMGFCRPDAAGYMVIFGTGRLQGGDDFDDLSVQSLYGIYDWGPAWEVKDGAGAGVDKYYGSFGADSGVTIMCESNCTSEYGSGSDCDTDCNGNIDCLAACDEQVAICQDNCGSLRTLSNMSTIVSSGSDYITLLQQRQTWVGGVNYNSDGSIKDHDYGESNTDTYDDIISVLSDNVVDYIVPEEVSDFEDVLTNKTPKHVGWYFDLPTNGARIINDVQILDGKVISTHSVPSQNPCEGGGESWHFITNACDGGRSTTAFYDLNGDGLINEDDYINIGTDANPIWAAPSSIKVTGLSPSPTIIERDDGLDRIFFPGKADDKEGKGPAIISGGVTGYNLGIFYWRELMWQ